jgi:hypothetical protein
MSTFLIFVVITLLVAIGIGFVIVGKENTPEGEAKKPNSLFPVEDHPAFEDAPVAVEKPVVVVPKPKKKYYNNNNNKKTTKK